MQWRYTARFKDALTKDGGRKEPVEVTSAYDVPSIESERDGLERIESFLSNRKAEFGDRLLWVSPNPPKG